MDWVDKELSECQNLCRAFPAQFEKYKLLLPSSVDRSRIKPLNNSYIFHDLEISLSRNEIIKLLMTDKLYNQPYICIRELLQNSLDALRYRKALFVCSDVEWNKGQVDFLHTVDEDGYEIIQCKDTGVGMDRDIVTRFFTKAGRSFYRSPEFERERVNFRKKSVDYDPCSQFGIGFMSCFMLGDRIKIETRRDYGLGKNSGEPLVIEINGLGGLIIIRAGSASQEIGTTVTITSRKKPSFLDEWSDNVILTTALKHFAVATEFPVSGRCKIEELKDTVEIPITPSYIPTLIEKAHINEASFITIEQNFNELDRNLTGNIRESFLIDSAGLPTLKNHDTSWQAKQNAANRKHFSFSYNGTTYESTYRDQSQISIDGIFLCGVAGRSAWQEDLGVKMRLGNRPTHIECNPYSLDVRGNSKPEITPARIPVENFGFNMAPKWKALSDSVNQAAGRLWMKLLEEFIPRGLTSESFWQLFIVYNGRTTHVPLNSLWQYISVPVIENKKENWVKISELTKLTIHQSEDKWHFVTLDGRHIKLPLSFSEWEKSGIDHPQIQSQINTVILAISRLTIEERCITFSIYPPDDKQVTAASLAIRGDMTYIQTLRYMNDVKDVITAQAPIKTVNSLHPLVQQCLKMQDNAALSKFASSFVRCIVDRICSKEQKRLFENPNRWMKYSAHCYFAVDWSKYQDNLLKPPYKIWLESNEILEITESDLQRWRDSKPADL